MRQGRKVPIYESSVVEATNASLKTFGSIDAELFLVNHVHLLTNSIIFSRNVKGAAALRQASQPQLSVDVNDSSKEESISEASKEESISKDGPSSASSAGPAGGRPSLVSSANAANGKPQQVMSLRHFASARQENIRNLVPNLVHGTQRVAGGIAQGTARIVRDTGTMVRKAKTKLNIAAIQILLLCFDFKLCVPLSHSTPCTNSLLLLFAQIKIQYID
jgi:hypothetical protein